MSELINNNVFDGNKKFVDLSSLDYFWDKAKTYIDGVDEGLTGRVKTNEDAIKAINDELTSLSGGAGSIQTQISNAISALDLPNTYEAKGEAAKAEAAAKAYADGLAANYEVAGAAATAEQNAKSYVDGKDSAMDVRVKVLEAIDHKKLASDASAAAVATILDDAPESFDTLKEVAAWIANNDHASDVATLMTDVENLKKIDHDAYVEADKTVLADAKAYADGLAGNYDAAGSAEAAKNAAIADAAGKYQVAGNYEAEGAAAQALVDAKAYVDGKVDGKFDASGSAAAAQAAAIAQAKADAAEALKAYYSKTEVDNLLASNTAADKAYAKQYTDELFNSFQFAQNSDIDALFV